MDWSRNWPVDFNAGKIQFDSLHPSHNTGAIEVKMHGFVFEKKPSLKMLGLAFSSRLDWGSKTASKEIGALIRSMRFLSPEVAFYFCKSTICSCMEYCCLVWAGVLNRYLELLDKLQKRIYRTFGPSLGTSLAKPWLIAKCSLLKSFL